MSAICLPGFVPIDPGLPRWGAWTNTDPRAIRDSSVVRPSPPARRPPAIPRGASTRRDGLRHLGVAFLIAAAAPLHAPPAAAQADQRTLVSAAAVTLADFLAIPDMSWLRENLARAKAVIIAPQITRAGLVVGGSGGRAVVVAHDSKTGRWVGPAFYALTTASVGLQAGISVSEDVTLVMTDTGLQRLLANSFQMGGDVAIAAGPVDRSARADLVADFVSFSRSQGVYVGLDLTGTAVASLDDWNRIYYGRAVRTSDILLRQTVHNEHANQLLRLLARATRQ
jgi:lipid-binding SYLF domain-containing protein